MYNVLYGSSRAAATARTSFVVDMLGVAGMLYLGALARIPLPFSPAPLTLQTLVVLVTPFLLGRNRAFAGIALYIFLGLTANLTGVVLFAAASGATYGYLAGFLLAPVVIVRFSRTPAGMLTAMMLASALILVLGAAWLSLFLHVSFSRALLLGAVPFIPGDLIKIALACALVRRMSA